MWRWVFFGAVVIAIPLSGAGVWVRNDPADTTCFSPDFGTPSLSDLFVTGYPCTNQKLADQRSQYLWFAAAAGATVILAAALVAVTRPGSRPT
jgi:hypothetical protein